MVQLQEVLEMVTYILIWIILMTLVLIFNFRAHRFDDDDCACENPFVYGDMNNEFLTNHPEMRKIVESSPVFSGNSHREVS